MGLAVVALAVTGVLRLTGVVADGAAGGTLTGPAWPVPGRATGGVD
ncbi:hypothetical protein [Nonomuraea sp. NEAU-A123]|nr:hypothetical protein [Nonomuraea sp. NEAU-A123]MBT2228967.1 hypothetical protein [Nonomuraea sp. NEAU-A123]